MKYGFTHEQYDIIQNVLANYPQIEEAVLFGSRTTGMHKSTSDVDIALKGKEVDFPLTLSVRSHFHEDTYLPFFVDVIAYRTIKSPALQAAIKKGVVLYRRA